MTKTFSVRNWDAFQHYKDRNPPWIKLHNHLLDDYEFESLPDNTKCHLLCIWMLASRTNNKMVFDNSWVKRKIGANSTVDLDLLESLSFIEVQGKSQDASKPLVSEEKRRDREEAEKSRFKPPSLKEVIQYCSERNNGIDANKFVDYYSANGWMRGKNKIKDWKACIRTWEGNSINSSQKQNKPREFSQ